MLGWHITVFRQAGSGSEPAKPDGPIGALIAYWDTGLSGTDWLDELVEAGKAIRLEDDIGYAMRYTATAEHLLPHIIQKPPPDTRPVWRYFENVTDEWEWKVNPGAAGDCRADEWLLIEARDMD